MCMHAIHVMYSSVWSMVGNADLMIVIETRKKI